MSRIAVLMPAARLREVLLAVAQAGNVELVGPLGPAEGAEVEALRRLEQTGNGHGPAAPRLSRAPLDAALAEQRGASDLLAGEVELKRRAGSAVRHGSVAALVGWTPHESVDSLAEALAGIGGSVFELPRPSSVEPPTLLRAGRLARPFRPLVDTYGATRYTNVDPTPFAAVSFVLMFGIMFGDVGHGLLLVLLGLLLRRTRRSRLAPFKYLWPIPAAAGVVAAVFGLLYGEAFGPTGIVPTLWLDPLEEPLRLLAAALVAGAVLLAASYGIGILNRYREGGLGRTFVEPSAIAGFAVFLGGAIAAAGWYLDETSLLASGGIVAAIGVVLLAAGFVAKAGRGATAVAEAGVEVADAVLRIGANTISFTRLAAFGLMHAALADIVFEAAKALWGGAVGSLLAVIAFCAGNAAAFALEALVAGVQALRLEYYELFSRVFSGEGHRFAPWTVPVAETEEAR